jgi:hypothetical protein
VDLIIHHGASSRFNLDHWKALPALLHVSLPVAEIAAGKNLGPQVK